MTRGQLREHIAGCGSCDVNIAIAPQGMTMIGKACDRGQAIADAAGIEIKWRDADPDYRPRACRNGCGCHLMRWWKFCPACGQAIDRDNV